jgi:hypothetical protein
MAAIKMSRGESTELLGPSYKRERNRSISNGSTTGEEQQSSDSEPEETLVFPTSSLRKIERSRSFDRNPGVTLVFISNRELEDEHRTLWEQAAAVLELLEATMEVFSVNDLRARTRRITVSETLSSTLLRRRSCLALKLDLS